jgi:pyruvate carboxylase
MIRDVNRLLGDIVKVTPSSKCVGDLALYLVTRGLRAEDVTDPTKVANLDFPKSVVELIEGRLGFPHRGFPSAVVRRVAPFCFYFASLTLRDKCSSVLKGTPQLTTRPSMALAPANFDEVNAHLTNKYPAWEGGFEREDVVAYLLYPKVFEDYVKRLTERSRILTCLPTPVYFYGMNVGDSFNMSVPAVFSGDVLRGASGADDLFVRVSLKRVGPVQNMHRAVVFDVNGQEQIAKVPIQQHCLGPPIWIVSC